VAARKPVNAQEKKKVMASGKCYVCADLGVDHAGFDGYDAKDVHFDHYQIPFSSPGGAGTDVLPIHGAPGGSIVDDDDFETSTSRNCHRLRRNEFTTRADYVQELRARLAARHAEYLDDVHDNAKRNAGNAKYKFPVMWAGSTAEFQGKHYPVITEERRGVTWRRFLTTLRPDQVFTDHTSQVRPATKKAMMKMIRTFLRDGFPMFSAVSARVDKCGHVVIFDGNHRGTAYAISFGTSEPMPVMIWDIEPGDECALVDPAQKPEAKK
jgi:hypothetical protein